MSINSFMMGSLFFILTIIWTLNPEKFNATLITQLVLAIPLLFVSSLAYSKVGYWEKTKLWDALGWYTNNIGNIFILNVVGLMVAGIYYNIAIIYFALILVLMLIYSMINVIYKPFTFKEKLFKFLFFAVILFLGGILPILI